MHYWMNGMTNDECQSYMATTFPINSSGEKPVTAPTTVTSWGCTRSAWLRAPRSTTGWGRHSSSATRPTGSSSRCASPCANVPSTPSRIDSSSARNLSASSTISPTGITGPRNCPPGMRTPTNWWTSYQVGVACSCDSISRWKCLRPLRFYHLQIPFKFSFSFTPERWLIDWSMNKIDVIMDVIMT